MESSGQLMEFDKKYKCKVKCFSMSDIKLKYFYKSNSESVYNKLKCNRL